MLNIEFLQEILVISIALSAITCALIQKTKVNFKNSLYIPLYSLILWQWICPVNTNFTPYCWNNEDIFSLDVLTVDGHIKRGSYVSSHLHLNITYLLEADENESLIINEEETEGVKWLPIDKLEDFCAEEYMVKNVYNKLNEKIKHLK